MTNKTEALPTQKSDFLIRFVSSVLLIIMAITALWWGGFVFVGLLFVAGGLLILEWIGLVRAMSLARLSQLGLSLAGVVVTALAVVSLWLIREQLGFVIALWVLAMVWATDIGAYFAGRSFGGAQLAPQISPSKTWAGLFGGMTAALIVGATLGDRAGVEGVPLWIGFPLGFVAQMGDLFESWMKRCAHRKDSGGLIPGHGGVFDRLDGVLPVAIVMGLLTLLEQLRVAGQS